MSVGAAHWNDKSLDGASSWGPPDVSGGGPPDYSIIKPEILSPDDVSSVTYGTEGFSGSSASSPHVAGAAALLLSSPTYSGYGPDQLRTVLEGNATNYSYGSLPDHKHGYGFLTMPPVLILSISVSPGSWPLGMIPVNSIHSTFVSGIQGYFTAANDGDVTEDLTISVSNSNPSDWTAGADAGPNQFAMGWGQATTTETEFDTEGAYTSITTAGVPLTSSLAPGGDFLFDLQFQSPTSTGATEEQSITVTITAQQQ